MEVPEMVRQSEVLGIREAATLLGAHEQTVRRLARRGEIPAYKVGTDWRFRREALLRWTEEQRPAGRRPTVLIVEDDEKVRRAIGELVERCGCTARAAPSAVEGLALVAKRVPDLILLDLKMPGMNGPEFLARLREEHPTLPVVIVTAYPDSELMLEAMQHAPVLLLAKPLDRMALDRTLRSILPDRSSASSRGG
jgi:excisionase family DNA binding protein